jgi:hypothetical protein
LRLCRGTPIRRVRPRHQRRGSYRDAPGFPALLDRIEGNGVRTVIVEDASRFARDLVTQELGILALIGRGVRVLTSSGDNLTNTDDPFKIAMRQIAGAFAQLEKARLVAKLGSARERLRKQGRRSRAAPRKAAPPLSGQRQAPVVARRVEGPRRSGLPRQIRFPWDGWMIAPVGTGASLSGQNPCFFIASRKPCARPIWPTSDAPKPPIDGRSLHGLLESISCALRTFSSARLRPSLHFTSDARMPISLSMTATVPVTTKLQTSTLKLRLTLCA